MTNTLYRTALGSIALSIIMFTGHGFAQSPPTATEAFNLRIKCKKMSDEKAQDVIEMNSGLGWEIVAASNTSKYDPISNRCFGLIHQHITKQSYRLDDEYDEVFDLQIDDLLATATIKNGKKSGSIWDPDPKKRYPVSCMGGCPPNMGDLMWQAAEDYMNELMADPRK
jgi:hypothetical protein